MSAKDYNKLSDSEKKKEDWMNSKWRPMMGWTYMLTCVADFVIFPILWSLLQAASKGQVNVQWQPITLQGAGLFHIAMGAVLGIAAYGRTQEKLGGANNGGITLPPNVGTTYTPPGAVPQPAASAVGTPTTSSWGSQPLAGGSSFGSAPTTGYGSSWGSQPLAGGSSFGSAPTTGYGSSAGPGAPAPTEVITGFGGKPGPVIPSFPER